tara:strand:+ start:292 stop:912 length:621 start_codon:yes stop_codon:yes gene_type:complete
MNLKTLVQILIITLVVSIFLLVYYIYFYKVDTTTTKLKDKEQFELVVENEYDDGKSTKNSSSLEDVEYKSTDKKGNKYLVNAKFGKISTEFPNILILENVKGTFKMVDKSELIIFSDFAEYNSMTLDTKFYDNVRSEYETNSMTSDNLDLLVTKNTAKIYNNVKFRNKNTISSADRIKYDILSGNVVIDMFEDSKKVKIINNNGTN